MNKILAGILAVSMTAGLVSAQEPVLSRNAVGYVKVGIEPSSSAAFLVMLANPFNSLDDADHSLTNVFSAVPPGTTVSVWDPDAQSYVNYAKSARGAWLGAATSARLQRAEGAFVRVPAGANPFEIILMGEVPDSDTAEASKAGLTLKSVPFPAAILLTNTVMASALPNGTTLSLWDKDSQSYANYAKSARGAWLGAATTLVLEPGQAFFIRSGTDSAWNETKPYNWP